MTLLLDFVGEMITSMKTQWTHWDYLGQYVNPNRFKGNVFAPPAKTAAGTLARNVVQKIEFGLATTAIFTDPINFAGGKYIVGWTVLLAKNKVFLRDNKLVEELESQLSDKKYELGLWGWRYDAINADNLQVMSWIVKKYIDDWLFEEWSQIKNGTVYNDITDLLTQIISSAKTFLYFDSTSQFDDITRWSTHGGVTIMFDTGMMQHLSYDYSCARGISNPCDALWTTFAKNIKTLWKSTTTSRADTKNLFTGAIKRLGQTFGLGDQDEAFKTREADLLKSMYGTTRATTGLLFGNLWKVSYDESNGSVSTLGDIWKWAVSVAQALASGAVRSWNIITKDIWAKRDAIQSIRSSESSYNSWKDAFSTMMDAYIGDVFANQGADTELATFSEVKDITPAFKVLGDQIYAIKNTILGGKEKENSLLGSLWTASQLQCNKP